MMAAEQPCPDGTVAHPGFITHTPHRLHIDVAGDWIDANCYTDLWIELVHGLGLDPHPMLAFTLGIDFEGDQWTFFKPPIADLRRLYGIDLAELVAYRPLPEHLAAQLRRGNIPIMEADAYFLPDVPQTYHRTHAKTTVAVVSVAPAARVVRYLHNSGCFELAGADFDGLLRVGERAPAEDVLPPYLETAKLTTLRRAGRARLAEEARELAAAHLGAEGRETAMERFLAGFDQEIRLLAEARAAGFDGYAFATLRQLGAACALAARFVQWVSAGSGDDLGEIRADLETVSRSAKRLILKAARTASTGRPLDGAATYLEMETAWRRLGSQAGRISATARQTAKAASLRHPS